MSISTKKCILILFLYLVLLFFVYIKHSLKIESWFFFVALVLGALFLFTKLLKKSIIETFQLKHKQFREIESKMCKKGMISFIVVYGTLFAFFACSLFWLSESLKGHAIEYFDFLGLILFCYLWCFFMHFFFKKKHQKYCS
jgi:hypothetical protein